MEDFSFKSSRALFTSNNEVNNRLGEKLLHASDDMFIFYFLIFFVGIISTYQLLFVVHNVIYKTLCLPKVILCSQHTSEVYIRVVIITLNIIEKEAQTLNNFPRAYRKLMAEPELKPKLSELKNDAFFHSSCQSNIYVAKVTPSFLERLPYWETGRKRSLWLCPHFYFIWKIHLRYKIKLSIASI